ncbi:glycine betaine/proline transport system substrate-binding protein [Halobacillus dabanensis]|uniref:Glycine betaine/proline transport system substrate-binding protein n=1 Tax=Halobacillus dabanensis TaxID=240302 RepID=A0A1I3RAA8_HALDA|nr:glycine betaine ABC transporter substrate-binding protein [Halobacillus dabanensis]SFJ42257.1 glycine betaine/proline transport system substrate-binding protein [Halobacillus dabanensis]
MKQLRKWLPAVFLGILLILAACGESEEDATNGNENNGDGDQAESSDEKGTISIGMNNWAENVAVSNMWKLILEDKGYTVELNQVEKGFLYEALSSGDLDIGMEIWLPNTDKAFYEKYEEEIDWRETWYEGTELGLAVPSYMEDINSIEDLKGSEAFPDKQIVGIDAGASIMSLTDEVINEYGLDYSLASSSEPTMITELKSALESEEPIVATLWKPHWVFAEMDLKFLEDSKNVYGDSEDISYAARKGLEEDQPEVVKWFDNFKLSDEELSSLMASINEADDEQEGAQKWIDEHQDLIEEWTKE